ncbi:Na-translocating system protein MpsC family protein [Desulfosporosinus sp. FKB]|uniref:Na-translocating system protein MpsC family protein n=1 Tax=Desulfosporosinus sp. FKB TaxID=1969835 RepID=UPI000B49FD1F|nr:Na-translocating system protein MpsC family protein [Desulfosporosinus sp. FKB]
MFDKSPEMQEKIRKLAVKIVKHYRGKGPEYVIVRIDDELITITIKGILSNLSEILVEQGDVDRVKEYWKTLRPYLENQFAEEVYELIGRNFEYTWQINNLESSDRTIALFLKLIADGSIEKKKV